MSNNQLSYAVGELLQKCGQTLSIAETCTGGLLGHQLTNVPGSSHYFLGGIIAYSNVITEYMLRVNYDTFMEHGAISEPMALEMARGVRELFRTGVGLSVVGIAGPGGGTLETPVGLVYVGLSAQNEECHRFIFESDREGNKASASMAALEILVSYLQGSLKK
ncbi:MAG: CinA family protein [Chloroflexota bacterium]